VPAGLIVTHCMSVECFTLDTNILVYAMNIDAGERHLLASRIIEQAVPLDCRLTLQSISEFYSVVSRKRLVRAADAVAQAEDWLTMFATVTASAAAIRLALTSAVTGQASYWDALLVATAAEAGCTSILTEDLADGTILHGVRILNPFGDGVLTPAAAALLAAD
jgi:predicted nucleic acid-binding protein